MAEWLGWALHNFITLEKHFFQNRKTLLRRELLMICSKTPGPGPASCARVTGGAVTLVSDSSFPHGFLWEKGVRKGDLYGILKGVEQGGLLTSVLHIRECCQSLTSSLCLLQSCSNGTTWQWPAKTARAAMDALAGSQWEGVQSIWMCLGTSSHGTGSCHLSPACCPELQYPYGSPSLQVMLHSSQWGRKANSWSVRRYTNKKPFWRQVLNIHLPCFLPFSL